MSEIARNGSPRQVLPLRDEAPYRRLERGMRRVKDAKAELTAAHAELTATMDALRDFGLVVRLADDTDLDPAALVVPMMPSDP